MAININHSNNTFCSNSGTFIFGTGIVPNANNTVYSSNFSGKYYGDGSELKGLQTGNFVTTGNLQFVDTEIENYQSYGIDYSKGSGSYFINNCENLSKIERSNYSAILQGVGNCFFTADHSIILNGFGNCINNTQNSIIIGTNSQINDNPNSISIGKNNINDYGCNRAVIGIDNNISNGCSVYVIGSGITLSTNVPSNTLYVNNLCVYDGAIYGNGSGITGLAFSTGDFITTGQTGDFGTLKLSESGSLCLGEASIDNGSCNLLVYSIYSTIQENAYSNLMVGGRENIISGGVYNSLMLGGCCNRIGEGVNNVAILGGCKIHALDSCTTYSTNFCTYGGKYYGDASQLTGLATGSFITTGQTGAFGGAISASTPLQTSVLLTGSTGFNASHQTKNVGILAINCFHGQPAAGNSGYLLLNKGDGNETCNLFQVSGVSYCVGTFSAMLIGNGYVDGAATTTSMRIDGAYGNGQILNQVKNIYYRTKDSNDANVVIEDNNFRIAVSGITGTMVWSSKIDLLDMFGYE